jgi:hypothetical protein
MLLKGSRISEVFPLLLEYIEIYSSMTPCMYFVGNGNERGHSHICYIYKNCQRLHYFISVMVNGLNTDSFIILTPIVFLSTVRTFIFKIMEMTTGKWTGNVVQLYNYSLLFSPSLSLSLSLSLYIYIYYIYN